MVFNHMFSRHLLSNLHRIESIKLDTKYIQKQSKFNLNNNNTTLIPTNVHNISQTSNQPSNQILNETSKHNNNTNHIESQQNINDTRYTHYTHYTHHKKLSITFDSYMKYYQTNYLNNDKHLITISKLNELINGCIDDTENSNDIDSVNTIDPSQFGYSNNNNINMKSNNVTINDIQYSESNVVYDSRTYLKLKCLKMFKNIKMIQPRILFYIV